jgi:hypothetical protein
MTVWQMTDNEYFIQVAIKVGAILIILALGIIAWVKEKKK